MSLGLANMRMGGFGLLPWRRRRLVAAVVFVLVHTAWAEVHHAGTPWEPAAHDDLPHPKSSDGTGTRGLETELNGLVQPFVLSPSTSHSQSFVLSPSSIRPLYSWDGEYLIRFNTGQRLYKWDGNHILEADTEQQLYKWDGHYLREADTGKRLYRWDGTYVLQADSGRRLFQYDTRYLTLASNGERVFLIRGPISLPLLIIVAQEEMATIQQAEYGENGHFIEWFIAIAGSIWGLAGGIIGIWFAIRSSHNPGDRTFAVKVSAIGWTTSILTFLVLLLAVPDPYRQIIIIFFLILLPLGFISIIILCLEKISYDGGSSGQFELASRGSQRLPPTTQCRGANLLASPHSRAQDTIFRMAWTTPGLLLIAIILYVVAIRAVIASGGESLLGSGLILLIFIVLSTRLCLGLSVALFVDFPRQLVAMLQGRSLAGSPAYYFWGVLTLICPPLLFSHYSYFLAESFSFPRTIWFMIIYSAFLWAGKWIASGLPPSVRRRLEIIIFGRSFNKTVFHCSSWSWLLIWLAFAIFMHNDQLSYLIYEPQIKYFYHQEAVPIITELRLRVSAHQEQFKSLPGIAARHCECDPSLFQCCHPTHDAQVIRHSTLQTWRAASSGQSTNSHETAEWDYAHDQPSSMANPAEHFSSSICFPALPEDSLLKPQQVFYRAACRGVSNEAYIYVLGICGDGDTINSLIAGTGYAVLKLANPSVNNYTVAKWQRFKPPKKSDQLLPVTANEYPFDYRVGDTNICWLGDFNALLSDDEAVVNEALGQLRAAGWQLSRTNNPIASAENLTLGKGIVQEGFKGERID